MTGNDIVDTATAAAESNWQRTGFLQKIFTQQEQDYIHNTVAPGQTVWRLWSMKESAYKVYIRQHGGRFFAPQKINCTLLCETTGEVVIQKNTYRTITSATKNYIYSIAMPELSETGFISHCFGIPGQYHNLQQKFIYEKLTARYACLRHENADNYIVLKEKNNIPFLYCKKEKKKIPVSITHHGNYAAFTIN